MTGAIAGPIAAVSIGGKKGRTIFTAVEIAVLLEENRRQVAQMLLCPFLDI